MREELTSCPICKGEIPLDTTQCRYCGALFAAGSGTGHLIQKGIICNHCGERTYSTEICNQCGQRLSIKCPECGTLLPLNATSCNECGEAIRKFGKYRGRIGKPSKRVPSLAAVLSVTIFLIAAALYAFFNPPEVTQAAIPTNPRPIDADYDGVIERWEYYDEEKRIERVEVDGNADGKADQWISYSVSGQKTKQRFDEDGNGVYEKEETFWPDGGVKLSIQFSNEDQDVKLSWTRFRPDGGKIEEAFDNDKTGLIDRHYKYTPDGHKYIEGIDTNSDGFLDKYRTFNQNGKVVQESFDADANEIFEKTKGFNTKGQLIWETFDENQNGLWEKKIYYRYNGNVRWVEYDSNGDGNHEVSESYTKKGTLARTGYDTNDDTSPDWWK